MAIWINNSVFFALNLLKKIYKFIKPKIKRKKVAPEVKTEKIVITNLFT